MKSFLLKIGFATLWFLFLLIMLHSVSKIRNICDGDDKVFLLGDSQMYVGLDVSLLCDETEKQVLVYAHNGAGVYDFLVSEKNIPDNAICIVSFSEAALLRNPLSDYNRTGLEFSCLKDLYSSGCPFGECMRILGLSKKKLIYRVLQEKPSLIPYADSLFVDRPLPNWVSMFEEKKEWFSWKAQAYEKGLQDLYDKHAQMILVKFPFDESLESLVDESVNRHLSDSLATVLIEKYELKCQSIMLESDSLLMWDVGHLNEVGARLLTTKIVEILQKDTTNNYFLKVVID